MIFLQPCVRLRIIKSQRQNGRMGSLRLSLSGMDFRVYGMPTVCGGTMIWLKKDGFDEEIIMSATFGERIKRLRKAYELTQKDVDTFLVNRSRTALTYWESGQGVPGAKNLSSLADFFGVTTDWLLGRSYVAYTEDSVVLAEYSAWRRIEEYTRVHQEFAALDLYELYITNYMDIRREYSLASRANIAVLLQLISITNKKEILQLRKIAWLEQLKEIFRTNEPVYVLEEIDS